MWTAPAEVEVRVEAVGAAGGLAQNVSGTPGQGDGVSGMLDAAGEGHKFVVCVDSGAGQGGEARTSHDGGGEGGGFSGVFEEAHFVRVIAAGGGGAGEYESGGDAGHPGSLFGSSEAGGGSPGSEFLAGGGGSVGGEAGSYRQGGHGGNESGATIVAGGGGGGGYYGGGGGGAAATFSGGGGGGGDSCGVAVCEVQAAAGTVHGPGAGGHEAHVTLTTYPLAPPTAAKVTKNSGPATGGVGVAITGTNLRGVTAVQFGGVSAKYIVAPTGTEVIAVSPAREEAGTVDVTITTIVGTSAITSKDHYKYLPVITSVFPSGGPITGINEWGAAWITGYGFAEGFPSTTAVSYGITAVASEHTSCFPHTFCEVWVPPHAAGKVDVKVTVNSATSAKTKSDQYTYK